MRYIDAEELKRVKFHPLPYTHITPSDVDAESYKRGWNDAIDAIVDCQPTADVRKNVHAKKVIGGGEHDGSTCWFECDNCGLAVDIGDVFCKHCGARFVP